MAENPKIKSLEELASLAASLRSAGRKIVHCHGSFESLDVGSIRLLTQAKKQGDVLLVTLPPASGEDGAYPRQWGCGDPRAEALAALGAVDFVAVARCPEAAESIESLRPHFYVPGDEPPEADEAAPGTRKLEETVVAAVGGVLCPIHVPGRARGARRPLPLFPQAAEFLASFSKTYTPEAVLARLDDLRSERVLLVGETIIDEYHYCETLGKSGKEPILAVKYVSAERFAGGVLATANQVADFVEHVGIVSALGAQDSHETFIRERLDPKIDASFLFQPGAPTTIKRRFLEIYPLQKLFEVYILNDEIDAAMSKALHSRLRSALARYDVVIVTDYGHGILTPELVDLLCSQSKFLAVNTQTNAANQGFNTVSKYRRADYICISEKELRLEARSRTKDLRVIVSEVAEKLGCERVLVTRGEQGCLCYRKGEGFCTVPVFTQRIVDRIGAGDAVLAVTSPCVARDMPMELVGFIGNAVGALAVETVGHRSIVTKARLRQSVEALLAGEHEGARP